MIELKFTVTTKHIDLKYLVAILESEARGCANELKGMEEAIVGNWVNKPTFTVRGRDEGMKVTFEVVPTGNITRWRWVSRGTRDKDIVPKTKPALVFPFQGAGNSYLPKTLGRGGMGYFYGGAGKKVGPIQQFKKVHWPGIAPRQFEEGVMFTYAPTFAERMRAALARAKSGL